MPIETILILVVVTLSIVWAFKTGYIKALWKGYVFSFAHAVKVRTRNKGEKTTVVFSPLFLVYVFSLM